MAPENEFFNSIDPLLPVVLQESGRSRISLNGHSQSFVLAAFHHRSVHKFRR
jgi:hypothetical protein